MREKLTALARENEELRAKLSDQTDLNSYLLQEKDRQMEDIEMLKSKAMELVCPNSLLIALPLLLVFCILMGAGSAARIRSRSTTKRSRES
jgi:hypothetical protein